jgi:hypothetical protein
MPGTGFQAHESLENSPSRKLSRLEKVVDKSTSWQYLIQKIERWRECQIRNVSPAYGVPGSQNVAGF